MTHRKEVIKCQMDLEEVDEDSDSEEALLPGLLWG
jgi:hypothetical protein